MRMLLLGLAAGCMLGCAASAGPQQGGGSDKGVATVPEGSRFVCHLNCSGTESHAYGPTDEQARENTRALVAEQCNPNDGQYFLVCEPLE